MNQTSRAAGYAFLVRELAIDAVPNWHTTLVSEGNLRHTRETGDRVTDIYPAQYWPGSGLGGQLELALKYDGTNLHILAAVFRSLSAEQMGELTAYIGAKPFGRYRPNGCGTC